LSDAHKQSLKELRCLYDISSLIEQPGISLDTLLRQVVNLIPTAFEFAEFVTVKISLAGQTFYSDGFETPVSELSLPMTVDGVSTGRVQVGYRAGVDTAELERVLTARTKMLKLVAERLARVIERINAQEALRQSEERFRLAVRGTNVGLWDRPDMESDIEWWSPRFYELFGYQPGEITPRHSLLISWLHPDDKPRILAALNNHLQHKTVYDVEYRVLTRTGHYRWIRSRAQALWDKNGTPIRLTGSIEDIDDRKRAEAAWRQYEFMVNNSDELMTLIDREHTFVAVSAAYCQAHQKKAADIIGKHIGQVWGRDVYQDDIKTHLDNCFSGEKIQYKSWVRFAGLGPRFMDVRYSPYHNDQGDITHTVVVSRDITEQKNTHDALQGHLSELKSAYEQAKIYAQELRAEIEHRKTVEQALQWALTQNRQVLKAISSILIGLDPYNQITHWNEAAEQTFGLSHTDIIGQTLTDETLNWDLKQVQQGAADCLRKKSVVNLRQVRYTRLDGKEGFLNIAINPFEPGGVLLLADDITEYKILESQLTQAQKLESIGRLAAGIAHEINSPAQFISDNLGFVDAQFAKLLPVLKQFEQLLARAKENNITPAQIAELEETIRRIRFSFLTKEIPLALEDALDGIKRVAAIIHAMKIFSHPGTPEKVTININQAIESTILVARNEWKYVADVKTTLATDLPLVPCLPNEFNQVILNIIINAAHTIRDVVGPQPDRKGQITIATRQLDESWVEIAISDTGAGIPPEIRPKVFDPFFTTKEVGRGTGQGLAIVHSVITEKHQGKVMFETEMGAGTTFFICLPLYQADVPWEVNA